MINNRADINENNNKECKTKYRKQKMRITLCLKILNIRLIKFVSFLCLRIKFRHSYRGVC